MAKKTFNQIYLEIGELLESQFDVLELSQNNFIQYCKEQGKLLFIEEQRLDDEELSYSDGYKIEKVLKKVLAIEYKEDMDTAKAGSTEVFHAVIALPLDAQKQIEKINLLKKKICDKLKETRDAREKVHGQWEPMNKQLLKAVGKPRANLKQVKRKLNFHQDLYERVSLSGTFQRTMYYKTYEEIMETLFSFNSQKALNDIEKMNHLRKHKAFAFFYDIYHMSMVANFKGRELLEITNKAGEVKHKGTFTQKISSPIYILTEDVNQIETHIKYNMNEKRNTERNPRSPSKKISKKPVLESLPVYTYL
jgi:hypothetical protein